MWYIKLFFVLTLISARIPMKTFIHHPLSHSHSYLCDDGDTEEEEEEGEELAA